VTIPEVRYSAEHMVFKLVPCPTRVHAAPSLGSLVCLLDQWGQECEGCLGDGTRVDLSKGIPVREVTPHDSELLPSTFFVPVEVSDLKEDS
jgi:hypothetical protein